jgi:hypothetical protein
MEIVFKFEALIQRETIHFYQMEIVIKFKAYKGKQFIFIKWKS